MPGNDHTMTYKGVAIPVIDPDNSPREELLRYIRILEDRLDLSRVFVEKQGRDDPSKPLRFDLECNDSGGRIAVRMGLVGVYQSQEDRVRTLAQGIDRVGCLEIGRALSMGRIAMHEIEDPPAQDADDTSKMEE